MVGTPPPITRSNPFSLIRPFHQKSCRKCISSLEFSTLRSMRGGGVKIIYDISAGSGTQSGREERPEKRCPSSSSLPAWRCICHSHTGQNASDVRTGMSRCHEKCQKRDHREHADTRILSPWVSLKKILLLLSFSFRQIKPGRWGTSESANLIDAISPWSFSHQFLNLR